MDAHVFKDKLIGWTEIELTSLHSNSEALAHLSVLKSALCPFLLFFSVHRDVLLLLLPLGSSHGGNGFLAARGLASGLPRELWTAESPRDSEKGI